jgi:transposase
VERGNHSSVSKIRQRLPLLVHVLKVPQERKLLRGNTVAVDSTTVEANAAIMAIVRKDTGEDWKEYVKRLASEEGIEDPTDEDMRRFDKNRSKKVPDTEWQSPINPDSRIAKMKDGRTHLAHKPSTPWIWNRSSCCRRPSHGGPVGPGHAGGQLAGSGQPGSCGA